MGVQLGHLIVFLLLFIRVAQRTHTRTHIPRDTNEKKKVGTRYLVENFGEFCLFTPNYESTVSAE